MVRKHVTNIIDKFKSTKWNKTDEIKLQKCNDSNKLNNLTDSAHTTETGTLKVSYTNTMQYHHRVYRPNI